MLAEKAKVLKLQSELADMQRKLEGKTANELGEGSEIDLFEQLKATFEGDRIRRVGKGVNGADVIHEVIHNGKLCGKIIYDAKNRNAWQNEFVTKLSADKMAQNADHAMLSSNKFPKDRAQLHNQDGVIVASPAASWRSPRPAPQPIVQTHELRISNEAREARARRSTPSSPPSAASSCWTRSTRRPAGCWSWTAEEKAHRRLGRRNKLIQAVKKGQRPGFEIDRIIGTAGNGPEDVAAA